MPFLMGFGPVEFQTQFEFKILWEIASMQDPLFYRGSEFEWKKFGKLYSFMIKSRVFWLVYEDDAFWWGLLV